jgi:glycosyltransferase 2 family protein
MNDSSGHHGFGGALTRAPADARAQRRRKVWRRIGMAASLVIICLSVFVLVRTLAGVSIAALRAAIAATSAEQLAMAGALTAVSYLALTFYDALALRQLKARVPYPTTALASFTSYAISFMLGFPLITGGAVRFWVYSQAGLAAGKVASLTLVAGITFWLGMGLVVGAGLIVERVALADLNQLKVEVNALIGFGVLAFIAGYLVWVSLKPRRVQAQGFKLDLPGFRLTLAQMALGVIDVCAGAGALYALLPKGHGLDFFTFAASYAFACMLGIASHAPGGIGVLEAAMIKIVPTPSEAALLASLLLFRIIYYLGPFVLALALLGAGEIMRRWASLRAAMEKPEDD